MKPEDWLDYKYKRLLADKEADKSRPLNKKAYKDEGLVHIDDDFSWLKPEDYGENDQAAAYERMLKQITPGLQEVMRRMHNDRIKENYVSPQHWDSLEKDFYDYLTGTVLKDSNAKKNTKGFNHQNYIEAMDEDIYKNELRDVIIDYLADHLTEDQFKYLTQYDDFNLDRLKKSNEKEEPSPEKMNLIYTNAHLKHKGILDELNKQANEMPDILYRGAPGIKTHEKKNKVNLKNAVNRIGNGEKVTFVSPDPSVAASYSRKDKFQRVGVQPLYFGDKVYRIRTKGLDPEKYKLDTTAVTEELEYGPQYYYEDDIPNEEIEITDSAGNTRKVPRIEFDNFNSDRRLKESVIGGKYGFSN